MVYGVPVMFLNENTLLGKQNLRFERTGPAVDGILALQPRPLMARRLCLTFWFCVASQTSIHLDGQHGNHRAKTTSD